MQHRKPKDDEMHLEQDEHWRVDKKIPVVALVALIGVLIGQALIAVNWSNRIDSRMASVEDKVIDFNRRFETIWRERDGTRDRLTGLEVQTKNILDLVSRIDRRLEARKSDTP